MIGRTAIAPGVAATRKTTLAQPGDVVFLFRSCPPPLLLLWPIGSPASSTGYAAPLPRATPGAGWPGRSFSCCGPGCAGCRSGSPASPPDIRQAGCRPHPPPAATWQDHTQSGRRACREALPGFPGWCRRQPQAPRNSSICLPIRRWRRSSRPPRRRVASFARCAGCWACALSPACCARRLSSHRRRRPVARPPAGHLPPDRPARAILCRRRPGCRASPAAPASRVFRHDGVTLARPYCST